MWIVVDPEIDLGEDPCPPLKMELRESLLGGEILDLHQMMEAGPDPHPLLEESIQTPFQMRTMPVEHSKFI